MKYTKAQFLKDVAAEAKALKKNATKEELGRLDLNSFDPHDFNSCVYGQMVGHCRESRAVELITKCCTRFIINNVDGRIKRKGFSEIQKCVNGTVSPTPDSVLHFSSIEAYIITPRQKNANLIAYLRGERKDLVL